jgi:hypothetical protein
MLTYLLIYLFTYLLTLLTYLLTYYAYLLTYLLTPWRRFLLENLTGLQLVKKFLASYVPWRFITPFTSARHLSILGQPNQFHTLTSYLLKIHYNIILSSTPGSTQWSFSLRFHHQTPVHASPVLHPSYMTPHLIRLDFITHTIMGKGYTSWSSEVKQASKRMKRD